MPNFYLVGCYWEDSNPKDQLPRFIKNNIWENGRDARSLDVIKQVIVGSRVAAKKSYPKRQVLEIFATGTVVDNSGDGMKLSVIWDDPFPAYDIEGQGGYSSRISKINKESLIKKIFANDFVSNENGIEHPLTIKRETNSSIPLTSKQYSGPLNLVLYGPPGTGKTYNAINRALEIIGYQTDKQPRSEIKKLYKSLVEEGRIMFTTFHQSMSYEDFIEGIKPDDPQKQGTIHYSIQNGVFKLICKKANEILSKDVKTSSAKSDAYPANTQIDDQSQSVTDRNDLFEQAYKQLLNDVARGGNNLVLKTIQGLPVQIVDVKKGYNLRVKHTNGGTNNPYPVTKEKLKKLFLRFHSITEIIKVFDDIRSEIGGSNASTYWAVLNEIFYRVEANQSSTNGSPDKTDSNNQTISNNVVLIIDEINRGNISQIFGELITLVEDDKRMGRDEALSITLPYSKNPFCVPPNLYIVGTMNTADRSVEALDTALRRRFSFEEMPPRYSIKDENNNELIDRTIGDINLMQLLKTINKRIELLLDKDHLIGHSYFMSVNDLDALRKTLKHNIVPLLQEYFFGDPGKIGLILGKGFVQANSDEQTTLADFEYEGREELSTRLVYNVAVPEDNDLFLQAIKDLLGTNNEPTEIHQ